MIAILGDSNTGKTTLAKHIILKSKNMFDMIFLLQGSTPSSDNLYHDFVWPCDMTFNKPTDYDTKSRTATIKKYVKDLTLLSLELTKINGDIAELKKTNPDASPIKTLFLIDDIGNDLKNFSNIGNVARHSKISIIFLIHKETDLDKETREKITHYFISSKSPNPIKIIKDVFSMDVKLYEEKKMHLINSDMDKRFFLVCTKTNTNILYFCLDNDDFENLKKESQCNLLKRFSKERRLFINALKKLTKRHTFIDNID